MPPGPAPPIPIERGLHPRSTQRRGPQPRQHLVGYRRARDPPRVRQRQPAPARRVLEHAPVNWKTPLRERGRSAAPRRQHLQARDPRLARRPSPFQVALAPAAVTDGVRRTDTPSSATRSRRSRNRLAPRTAFSALLHAASPREEPVARAALATRDSAGAVFV